LPVVETGKGVGPMIRLVVLEAMFVQSIKFIENHHGNEKRFSIYGQEYTATTYKLAKMNLAIRGIAANR
jgi:type I restriction-modification system DNA methylase subunit